MAHRIRYPRFRAEFTSDSNQFNVMYDPDIELSDKLVGNSIIGFESKNAMSDDSATIQITLFGNVFWEKVLNTNDIVRLYTNTNAGDDEEQIVTVGMITSVTRAGDFSNNQMMYRITAQSFCKPFMKFGLGIIQEVNAVMPTDIGWLPDDKDTGIEFTGKTAKEVMQSVLNRFTPYMKYNYKDWSHKIEDHFTWTLDSWTQYEQLQDPSPFTNFDGTLKQMMDTITCAPFNELFFRNAQGDNKGKAEMVLRRTPFNQSDWVKVAYEEISSEDVVAEDLSKTDAEAYSIFSVSTSQMNKDLTEDVISRPQYHQELVDRYGYSRLESEFMFLPVNSSDSDAGDSENDGDTGNQDITYDRLFNWLMQQDKDKLSKNIEGNAKILAGQYKGLKKADAKKFIQLFVKGKDITPEYFKELTGVDVNEQGDRDDRQEPTVEDLKNFMEDKYPKIDTKNKSKAIKAIVKRYKGATHTISSDFINKYKEAYNSPEEATYKEFVDKAKKNIETANDTGADASENPFALFSQILFNWYHNNSVFLNGEITVIGHPKFDLGKRLFLHDKQQDETWEFYIESVEHKFTYTEGYYTVLGVTRGLKDATVPNGSSRRFQYLWNKSLEFKGGLLGEKSLADMKKEGVEAKNKGKDGGDDSGGDVSGGGSLSALKKYKGKLPKYDNKTYPGNPQTGSLVGECTWYVYNRRKQFGLPVSGWGDAHAYDEGARAQGIAVGSTPKQGAIVNWEAYTKGGGNARTGHVAFVESVSKDGKTFHISEYNWAGHHIYGERTLKLSEWSNGIHFIYD